MIRTGEPVAIDDAFFTPRLAELARREGFRSILAVPLKAKGKAVGVLGMVRKREQPFSASNTGLLSTIAGQVGMAIQNASLYAQVQILAVTGERERIARELHDTVAQVLSYAQIKSAADQRDLHGQVQCPGSCFKQELLVFRDDKHTMFVAESSALIRRVACSPLHRGILKQRVIINEIDGCTTL